MQAHNQGEFNVSLLHMYDLDPHFRARVDQGYEKDKNFSDVANLEHSVDNPLGVNGPGDSNKSESEHSRNERHDSSELYLWDSGEDLPSIPDESTSPTRNHKCLREDYVTN